MGRRIEQAFGHAIARYYAFNCKEGTEIDPYDYMENEDKRVTTFEEEAAKRRKKQAKG